MATKTKRLPDNESCIQVIVQDEENEVRVHFHPPRDERDVNDWGDEFSLVGGQLLGLLVISRTLGTIIDVGETRGECD